MESSAIPILRELRADESMPGALPRADHDVQGAASLQEVHLGVVLEDSAVDVSYAKVSKHPQTARHEPPGPPRVPKREAKNL